MKQRCIQKAGIPDWQSWHHLRHQQILWDPKLWARGTGRRRGHPQSLMGWQAGSPGPDASAAPCCAPQLLWESGSADAVRWHGVASLRMESGHRCKRNQATRDCDGCRGVGLPEDPEDEETRRCAVELWRLEVGRTRAAAHGSRRPEEASHCQRGRKKGVLLTCTTSLGREGGRRESGRGNPTIAKLDSGLRRQMLGADKGKR